MKSPFRKPLRATEIKKQKLLKEYQNKAIEELEEIEFGDVLQVNVDLIRRIFGKSDDLVVRNFDIGGNPQLKAAIIYIDGLTDRSVIDEYILGSMMLEIKDELPDNHSISHDFIYNVVKERGLTVDELGETTKIKKAIDSILSGDCTILFDKVSKALLANSKGWAQRGVQEPQTESVVRGPRDGFTETIRTNTAQVRRRLKDPNLRVKHFQVGERSNTDVAIMYIEELADQKVFKEIQRRIEDIRIDGALESGYIEQLIEDHPWSPFTNSEYGTT